MIALMILTALIVYVGIALLVIKRLPSKKAKWIAIAVFVLIPTWDEIAGKAYFNYLCATEAGVKVYRTVELPAEYWDEQGAPKFFNKYGYLEHDFWVKEIDESGGHIERHSSVFSVDKDTSPVKERTSQEVLAEITTFRYWGGWVRRNFSPHNTANSCEFIDDPNFSHSFYGQLFKPAASSK